MKEGGKGKAKYDKSISRKGKGRSTRVYHNDALSWKGKSQHVYDDFCAQDVSAPNVAAMQNAVPALLPPPKLIRGSSVEAAPAAAAPKKARTTPQPKEEEEPAETQPCPDTLAAAAAANTPTAMAEGGLGREVAVDDGEEMLANLKPVGALTGIDPVCQPFKTILTGSYTKTSL